ncbi:hypothetical protein [Streptomyces sp. NBC_00239]|uniref:hypothetical protein n=1 Tax=Streptomyces sp. NBC_00239 TaxID=2903640 RepID=UPI002E2995A4|nr:hypothetical protein [Streptomyces sp. NBC_00239]
MSDTPAYRIPPHGSPATCPPPRGVPPFAPLRVGRGGDRLRRAVRRKRRMTAAGLAVAAAALAVSGPEAQASRSEPPPAPASPRPAAVRLVSAPVRIADAATVRLLRAGDRVDVVAAGGPGHPGAEAGRTRLVAAAARVLEVPPPEPGTAEAGALVVLSVPRGTARELVGAGSVSRLAVTLC